MKLFGFSGLDLRKLKELSRSVSSFLGLYSVTLQSIPPKMFP